MKRTRGEEDEQPRRTARSRHNASSSSSSSSSAVARVEDQEEEVEVESEGNDNIDGKNLEVHRIAKSAYKHMQSLKISDISLDQTLANNLVGKIMRLVLFMNLNKQKCTTKMIREKALKVENIKITKATRDQLIRIAMGRFQDLFGYSMISTFHAPVLTFDKEGTSKIKKTTSIIDGTTSQESVRKEADTDVWLLINLSTSNSTTNIRYSEGRLDNDKRGLLLTILAMIMMDDGSILETELLSNLETYFNIKGEKQSKSSGDNVNIGTFLRDIEGANYIEFRKSDMKDNSDNPIRSITYGVRSILEIGLPNILRFTLNLCEDNGSEDVINRCLGLAVKKRR